MSLDIHRNILNKLDYFVKSNKTPNIIFHGPSGCGKKSIMNSLKNMIYNNDKELINNYVMYVNCAHGKGIKFIRDELKFFAKTHINKNNGLFKSVILSNADKLTIDAQSALRRCIELFSHSTRFFMIVEDKYKLLKPILSRFVEIYVSYPIINNAYVNLNVYNVDKTYDFKKEDDNKHKWLKQQINKIKNTSHITHEQLCNYSLKFYEKGYSGLDLIKIIKNMQMDEIKKYQLLLLINKVKSDFLNEKLLMLFILNFLFIRFNYNLENMFTM